MQQRTGWTQVQADSAEMDGLVKAALVHLRQKEPHMAVRVLQRALELTPREPRCLSYLGVCMAMINRHSDKALELCEEALAFGCYGALFYCNLGKVHLLRGSRRKAYAAFRNGLKADPGNRGILRELSSMGERQVPFISLLPRSHAVNRFAGRMRYLLSRPVV
jgi:Flp pilus assembly protein TadD